MSTEPVDVLVVTAADGEDDAVRQVTDGALGPWRETAGPPDYGFAVWRCDFSSKQGPPLRFALTRAFQQGVEASGNAAGRLADFYNPCCLAMSGVCAGCPGWAELGDVIVADRVYRYDVGELTNTRAGATPEFHPDALTYPFRPQWKQRAEAFKPRADAKWLSERPRSRDLQGWWALREILEGRNPALGNDREVMCRDWTAVSRSLQGKRLIKLDDHGAPQLTPKGRRVIQKVLFENAGRLPEASPWKLLVFPLGTGSSLVCDIDIWEKLGKKQRSVCGFDMEGSVVGLTALIKAIPYIVVKGVMDFGRPDRNYGFRPFAARAAAEILIAFLRENMSPGGPTAAEILQSGASSRPAAVTNPGTLLNARYRVVPFIDEIRAAELDALRSWCEEPDRTSVRLFIGPGGSGKTRLFVDWAERLRKAGWAAGFLPEKATDQEREALLGFAQPVFVVVDYAEAWRSLPALLEAVAARRDGSMGKLRVALLAREVADWWGGLLQHSAAIAALFEGRDPTSLSPVQVEGPLRHRVFALAGEALAAARSKEPPSASGLDLTNDRFARVLYIEMAALAAVDGLALGGDALLGGILDHERHYWLQRYKAEYAREDLLSADFRDRAARLVAAVTLRGGVATLEGAEALNLDVDGPKEGQFLRFVRSLYPPADGSSYVGTLEPDLLGEKLVEAVLSSAETRHDYLNQVVRGADDRSLRQVFTLLGRVSSRVGEREALPWIARALDPDVSGRARAAFDAALTLGQETAYGALGRALHAALSREGSVDLAAVLEPLIPPQTVSLREVAAWASRCCLDSLRSSEEVECSRLWNNLSNRLSALGRPEDALQAAEEAVGIRRKLARDRPDAYLPDLALSLNTLGNRLSGLGRREDALRAAEEAVRIRRRLARERPDTFLSQLASSLNNLSIMLIGLGRGEDAVKAAEEAVGLHRRLARDRPEACQPDLALSLNNLGFRLSQLGRREDGHHMAEEAVGHFRKLARNRPDAFLPDLASSLNNLGITLSELGRNEDALQAAEEAMGIRRRLARDRPDAFLPDLALSLNNLGNRLSALGRREDALRAAEEAVRIRRRLARERPDAFLPDLAISLSNLGVRFGEAGRREDALRAAEEAVQLMLGLARVRPQIFSEILARSTAQFEERLTEAGRSHHENVTLVGALAFLQAQGGAGQAG